MAQGDKSESKRRTIKNVKGKKEQEVGGQERLIDGVNMIKVHACMEML
jgi:hypothetical protein